MTNSMEAAAEAVRSILPSPFQLSEGADRRGLAHRGTGGPARFAVLDDLNRRVCELVISHEAAADSVVTYAWLRRADLPGMLREAISIGGNVYVTHAGVSVRS